MNTEPELASVGLYDARYRAFLETVSNLRPSLHRYCARMTGSVMDCEDIVQEALFEAYRNVWSAAELQAENEDDSWSALMYSASSGV
jgi:RNA polymerase sigma-70 factor (ECF subfamily)